MQLSLLSGVVRQRKQMTGAVHRSSQMLMDEMEIAPSADTSSVSSHHESVLKSMWRYLKKNPLLRQFNLRVHKFYFQWDLILHLSICIFSLSPFFFTGRRRYALIPISVWIFYNMLFLLGPQHANLVIPGFGKFKHSFKATIEDFFSPKLLPIMSVSFLLVALSLTVTGHRLGGPPLCYRKCGVCLSSWRNSIEVGDARAESSLFYANDPYRIGCGYANGKEMLGFYTMAQTSFLLFLTVVIGMAVCLAWRVAEEEKVEQRTAENSLKKQDPRAFEVRSGLLKKFGHPAAPIRPEGSAVWVIFGIITAITFTLLGWHNWYVLPPSHTATLLIVLNLLTIMTSTLILHVSFFGRLLALYKRNFLRVNGLTEFLKNCELQEIDSWWNCRNFVLNDDLSLDYDMGGLAVSLTFVMGLVVFFILLNQTLFDGFQAMLEPPGSYCAYACMYITCCLIKLFTMATNTYEEQHRHIAELQTISNKLFLKQMRLSAASAQQDSLSLQQDMENNRQNGNSSSMVSQANEWRVDDEDYSQLQDDGPLDIDELADFTLSEDPRRYHYDASAGQPLTGFDSIGSGGSGQSGATRENAHFPPSMIDTAGIGVAGGNRNKLSSSSNAKLSGLASQRLGISSSNIDSAAGVRESAEEEEQEEEEEDSDLADSAENRDRSGSFKAFASYFGGIQLGLPSFRRGVQGVEAGNIGRGGRRGGGEGGGSAGMAGRMMASTAEEEEELLMEAVVSDIESPRPSKPSKGGKGRLSIHVGGGGSSLGIGKMQLPAQASSSSLSPKGTGVLLPAPVRINSLLGIPALPGAVGTSSSASSSSLAAAHLAAAGGGAGGQGVQGAGPTPRSYSRTKKSTGTALRLPLGSSSGIAESSRSRSSESGAAVISTIYGTKSLDSGENSPNEGLATEGFSLEAHSLDVGDVSASSAGGVDGTFHRSAIPPAGSPSGAPAGNSSGGASSKVLGSGGVSGGVGGCGVGESAQVQEPPLGLTAPRMPVLSRGNSVNMENSRQTIADLISQIRQYDPYPCILGIPVMPALFSTCKFYIFICYVLIGSRTMIACLRQIYLSP